VFVSLSASGSLLKAVCRYEAWLFQSALPVSQPGVNASSHGTGQSSHFQAQDGSDAAKDE